MNLQRTQVVPQPQLEILRDFAGNFPRAHPSLTHDRLLSSAQKGRLRIDQILIGGQRMTVHR